jgi:hypothetical protein
MTDHKTVYAALAEFPDYKFCSDGSVYSGLTKRTLKPIQFGAYVGLQLKDAHGQIQKRYLHRLIAEAFSGPCPDGAVCRHLDGDKTNNASANLAWGTQSQNNLDKEAHGTSPHGERNPMAKLSSAVVSEMRSERDASGTSYAKIAKKFGISTMTAFRAVTGRAWSKS